MPPRNKTLEYLSSLHGHGIKLSLSRIKELLRLLGNPQDDFPTIHIAGTNGKGSTAAYLSSISGRAGFKTGLYTSPHLIKFNERIQVSGRPISDQAMRRIAVKVRKAAKKMTGPDRALSFFEFTTAMAFLYFKERSVDIGVIETGMGGRFDATNVVTPLVSVITNIGLDHTMYLGAKVKDIAFEKAGIIKRGVPVITGEEKAEALAVIEKASRRMGARLLKIGQDFTPRKGHDGRLDYSGVDIDIKSLTPGLRGAHQFKNAACALAAIEVLRGSGFKIPVKAIRQGLKGTIWPARVDVVSRRPLVILDAAHNPDGALTLANALKEFRYKSLTLVLGIMADKDIPGILSSLAPLADNIIVCAPETDRAASPALIVRMLGRMLRPFSKPAVVKSSVKDGVAAALKDARKGDAVCVTGSIFTVGEAKKYLKA
ncbi:MAG: bifunctional folylpolyglutamate synthase/dihydrofolate synthase [Deltaproteobacteria bacterium]|nr:bifunctional folylpolyglutamate synthase/dihydrofolate synthase [Deltaproteobacteria bacterium]